MKRGLRNILGHENSTVKVLWGQETQRGCGDAALEEIQWVRCRGNKEEWNMWLERKVRSNDIVGHA